MLCEKDVEIPVRKGVTVKANIYRLIAAGNYIVLTSCSSDGKNLPTSDADPFESKSCGARAAHGV